MRKRYNEVMKHIEVTPEMRQRVLTHIENADLTPPPAKKVIRFPHVKQLATLAACLAIVLVGSLTLPRFFHGPDDPDVQVVNGMVEVASVKELAEAVNFPVEELSGLPFSVEQTTYTAYWGEMAEITYSGEGQRLVYRKGADGGDVSGDYTSYPAQAEISVGDITMTLKGDEAGYVLATWADGTYTYAASSSAPLDMADWKMIL